MLMACHVVDHCDCVRWGLDLKQLCFYVLLALPFSRKTLRGGVEVFCRIHDLFEVARFGKQN